MLELGGAASFSSAGQLGAGIEVDWYALRFLRLHAMIGAAWVPATTPSMYGYYSGSGGLTNRGAMKFFAGADGVLPFSWGELFAGLDSGAVYTSLVPSYPFGDCFGGCPYSEQWQVLPAARVRGGVDFTLARPLVIGFDLGYGLFAMNFGGEVHWAEVHARIGFAF
jgi:hypothetical protein